MSLNALIGIGLRRLHYKQILEERPVIGWVEVHSENFFHQGGLTITALQAIRDCYPISLHGVGLSLGSADGLDMRHLLLLKQLIGRTSPFMISEHLSWGYLDNVYVPDLLPIPYTSECLSIFCDNVNIAQDYLKREILIENPSSYIEYNASNQTEVDFLVSICKKTGAKILLDVNNVFVSCSNHGWDAKRYIDSIPNDLVKEIHLAGHSYKTISPGETLLIDTHDSNVCKDVWDLYDYAVQKFRPLPTLLEWDANIPNLCTLIKEAYKALDYIHAHQSGLCSYAT